MQTFLPFQDFAECARVLDGKRLPNQLNEVVQIIKAARGESKDWRNHPAIKMWGHNTGALILYGLYCYQEWQRRYDAGERGGKREHKSGEWLRERALQKSYRLPRFLTDEALSQEVHSAYRALLLSKDPAHYGQFGWPETPNSDSARIFEMIKEEMER